jgi:hypothetical protein
MLPLTLCQEPLSFHASVRVPGRNAILEMTTPELAPPRRGRKRKVFGTVDAIPADVLPKFWRRTLPEMCRLYGRVCAYLGMRIHEATGQPSVDHFVAKSVDPRLAYEWSNFRLAALTVNRSKKAMVAFVDPCGIGAGWIHLDFVTYEVRWRGPDAAVSAAAVANTLKVLNEPTFCAARQSDHGWYLGIPDDEGQPREQRTFAWLQHESPFVAAELIRQGLQ